MAIGTTPLFSAISGSVGPVDFRTRRNGKIEIGKKRIPTNPQSNRQLEVRAGYGRLHELWQNATYIDKAQYERLGKLYHTSAWNAFLMRHQSAMSAAPVASWGMVESSGSDLHDLTTNKNHGIINGATWEQTGPSNLSVLSFDGIDDYVDCGNDASLNITGNLTVAAWMKGVIQTNRAFVSKLSVVPFAGYSIQSRTLATGTVTFLINTGGVQRVLESNNAYMDNTWHHIVGVYDGQQMKLYADGILDNYRAQTGAINTNTNSVYIGARTGPVDLFNGSIANPGVYDYGVSDNLILQYYNNTKHLFGVFP